MGAFDTAGWPAARQAHRSATGQASQRGDDAVQTRAPSSIDATAQAAAVASSSGSIPAARSRSARVTEAAQRARCLAGLVEDGLVARLSEHTYALP